MEHQEWEPVIIGRAANNRKNNTNTNVITTTIAKSHPNQQQTAFKKSHEEEGDVPQVKKISIDFGKQVQQARTTKKLTQKELANALCVNVSIINDLERGILVHDGTLVGKLKKFLNLH